jgi:hypothetical protein
MYGAFVLFVFFFLFVLVLIRFFLKKMDDVQAFFGPMLCMFWLVMGTRFPFQAQNLHNKTQSMYG